MDVEPALAGRRKKLIWALESYERHGRPNCSECSDKMRADRGCKKPGYDHEPRRLWHFTSPTLAAEDRVLRECPIGRILRESPHAYDVLHAYRYSDSAGLDVLSYPIYLQRAFSVISGEKERLQRLSDQDRQAKRDAAHGADVLRRGASRG